MRRGLEGVLLGPRSRALVSLELERGLPGVGLEEDG
jgi:hypothetical protein